MGGFVGCMLSCTDWGGQSQDSKVPVSPASCRPPALGPASLPAVHPLTSLHPNSRIRDRLGVSCQLASLQSPPCSRERLQEKGLCTPPPHACWAVALSPRGVWLSEGLCPVQSRPGFAEFHGVTSTPSIWEPSGPRLGLSCETACPATKLEDFLAF